MNLLARCFAAILALSLFCGCSHTEQSPDAKPEGASLTPKEVLNIATQEADRHVDGLSNYKPQVTFRFKKEKIWSVVFAGQGKLTGTHFTVFVQDDTRSARYFEGK